MSQELTDFLTNLATDQDLVDEYNADPEGTMIQHNVPQHHRQLVLDKNYDEVQNVLGADYSITNNHVIRAYKN